MIAALPQVQYEMVIGLEVHAQLSTQTKLFCGCPVEFGAPPNTHICPVCTGQPGVLPVLNQRAFDYAILVGLALNGEIAAFSKFDRKQYFYPDLPKNYQISQYDLPLVQHGWVEIDAGEGPLRIGITRLHMEEDAGKLVHAGADRLSGSTYTLVDYNRAGTPLVEIVSEPDIRTAAQAVAYVQEIRRIVRYLGACDGNMQEGSMRCDVNISVRPVGTEKFGTKVEIKNINSFNSIQRAIEYEYIRQMSALNGDNPTEVIRQETRLWDENAQKTRSMRLKEGSDDYRYFPEPDLLPLEVTPDLLAHYQAQLPELPIAKRQRYQSEWGLSPYDAEAMSNDRTTAHYFEEAVRHGAPPKLAANWVQGDITAYLNEHHQRFEDLPLDPGGLAELIQLIESGTISNKIAKELLPELLERGISPKALVVERGLTQISDHQQLIEALQQVLAESPQQVAQYREGKRKLAGYFVGQAMKKTQGRADPQLLNQLLSSLLD
ncbi:Asp-tRNA(Asn)/Glu-tRNA(Gln) amidotransferase subunit GatB [Candidatus Cyanaurora vandensis]|uniref:Asp-tRNA(Asn)/Glu-tRNA(Gln) amidotransferase subunit GatB n=1 Tax=Candidatus Cyanaurora vandensis TaxID=2714958 RepID=UPI002581103E|nr:Asp-tRNA(Asn)/Glu-tRNA(Gln) amidotransferase subunit GatB [Candidatus Cyanaurora vandensis]